MTGQWKQALAELESYIAASPEIKISRQITIMPDDKRVGFYRLFDRARLAFLEEITPAIYSEACELSSAYLKEAEELKRTLKLSEIKVPPQLGWLLDDPQKGLSRALLNPLFELLKGSKRREEFEIEARAAVEAYWKPLVKQGYEDWVVLSLSNMLSPQKLLAPAWEAIVSKCHELQPDEKRGWSEEFVPEPQELERIELGHEGFDPAFIISDIILFSDRLQKYISFGVNLTDASWYAKNASERKEWIKLRDRGLDSRPRLNWPGVVVYTDNEPSEISIVADFGRFLRPEIILECMDREDWYQGGYLDKIKNRHEFFKPSLGTFIITRHPVPDEINKALETEETPVGQEITGENPESETLSSVEPTSGENPLERAQPMGESVRATPAEKKFQNIFIVYAAGYVRSTLTPVIDLLLGQVTKPGESGTITHPGAG